MPEESTQVSIATLFTDEGSARTDVSGSFFSAFGGALPDWAAVGPGRASIDITRGMRLTFTMVFMSGPPLISNSDPSAWGEPDSFDGDGPGLFEGWAGCRPIGDWR